MGRIQTKIKYGGYQRTIPYERLNSKQFKRVYSNNVKQFLPEIVKFAIHRLDQILGPGSPHYRPLVGSYKKEKSMYEAFREGILKSKFKEKGGNIKFTLINEKVISKLLKHPGSRSAAGAEGKWWLLHESPAPRVGMSTQYMFVPKKGEGRHGEGIMVSIDKANSFGVKKFKPYQGFTPVRALTIVKNDVNEFLKSYKRLIMIKTISEL
ncbi:MAG: hypothetical protein ACP6IQ_02310 [Candidatus Njordarchaeia archaeon]